MIQAPSHQANQIIVMLGVMFCWLLYLYLHKKLTSKNIEMVVAVCIGVVTYTEIIVRVINGRLISG